MRTDPLIVACPLCGQAPDARCLRQSDYGTGAPLRRMHRERYALAREELLARSRGWSRSRAAQEQRRRTG